MELLEDVDPEIDDDRVQQLFESDVDVYGRPSLFVRILAHNPGVLAARQEYVETLLQDGVLETTEAELAYVTGRLPERLLVLFRQPHRATGRTRRAAEGDCRGDADGALSPSDERERAIVSFARAAASDPKRVSETVVGVLRENGFTDADVVELVAVVGAAVAANVVADTLTVLPQNEQALEGYDT